MVQGELNQEPSPEGTVVQNPPTAPQNDGQFLQKYKWWIIGGAVIAAVATGGIALYMFMPAAAAAGAGAAAAVTASSGTTAASAGTTTVTISVTMLTSVVIRRGK